MIYFTTEQLGPNRSLTPEGFLLCRDVPVARVGTQMYGEGEVPVPAINGVIQIERREEDVFRPETIASLTGKSVVNDHPMTTEPLEDGWDVNPRNWRMFSQGVVLNPRRGDGTQRDYLLADLLVQDESAIAAVLDGKVEVSCGYNADYETLAEGRGRQHNILFNHVALVTQGRCGPRCAIGDEDMIARTRDEAPRRTNPTLDRAFAALDKIKRGFRAKDEKLMSEGMSEVEEGLAAGDTSTAGTGNGAEMMGEHHVHVHLPGAGGSGPAEVSDATDPAAAAAAGGGEGDLGARMQRLEALFAKFAPALQKLVGGAAEGGGAPPAEGGGEEGEKPVRPSAADGDIFAGPIELEDPVPAATGDDELFGGDISLEDPVPAATGDEDEPTGEGEEKGGLPDALKKGMKTGDAAVGIAVKGADGKFYVRPLKARTADAAAGTRVRDSAHLQERFTEVLARAEILAPGLKLPTFDAAMPATKTLDLACRLRRYALGRAWTTDKDLIKPLVSGDLAQHLPKMTCDSVTTVFNGAAELKRLQNNTSMGGSGRTADKTAVAGNATPKTVSEINARNRAHYGQPKNG